MAKKKLIQFETPNNYYCFYHAVERVTQYEQDKGKTAQDATSIIARRSSVLRCVRCTVDQLHSLNAASLDAIVHAEEVDEA